MNTYMGHPMVPLSLFAARSGTGLRINIVRWLLQGRLREVVLLGTSHNARYATWLQGHA